MSWPNSDKHFLGCSDNFAQRKRKMSASEFDWKFDRCPDRMLIGWLHLCLPSKMIGLRVMFLGWNNNYSRPHCADANDAFATMSIVGFLAAIGHHSYYFGSFYHHFRHQRPIFVLVFDWASQMCMRLTVNWCQVGCCHAVPMMNGASDDALVVVENAFVESIVRRKWKSNMK